MTTQPFVLHTSGRVLLQRVISSRKRIQRCPSVAGLFNEYVSRKPVRVAVLPYNRVETQILLPAKRFALRCEQWKDRNPSPSKAVKIAQFPRHPLGTTGAFGCGV